MTRTIEIGNGVLSAEISELGAELFRLRDSSGADWLWDGDPAWWSGRAPLLFPMVGKASGDRIRVAGASHPLPQHGFARRSTFEIVEMTADACLLRLRASEATRAAYPFSFQLDMAYALEGATLRLTATVTNEDANPLPCAFGYHPAFRWPLPGAEGAHEVRFEKPEPCPIRRLTGDGLLGAQEHENPAASGRLALDPALFDEGALIFDRLESRQIAFGPADSPEVAVSFPDMPHFGLWTKPGAPFLCLEPWQGFAAPENFDGDFAQRPGVVVLPPGAARAFAMAITIRPA
jgi:galactose mutarotase-like enzyme